MNVCKPIFFDWIADGRRFAIVFFTQNSWADALHFARHISLRELKSFHFFPAFCSSFSFQKLILTNIFRPSENSHWHHIIFNERTEIEEKALCGFFCSLLRLEINDFAWRWHVEMLFTPFRSNNWFKMAKEKWDEVKKVFHSRKLLVYFLFTFFVTLELIRSTKAKQEEK